MEPGRTHVERLTAALDAFTPEAERVFTLGHRLGELLADGARCLAAGNGGSAAHAQHLTAELVGRYKDERRPLSAIALHAETSTFTALVNDYPPAEVFARQIAAHGRAGDVAVLLSTSGRSENLLAAARAARSNAVAVWALTGPGPNPLADAADEVVAVDASSTATIQEVHQVAVHLLAAGVDAAITARS